MSDLRSTRELAVHASKSNLQCTIYLKKAANLQWTWYTQKEMWISKYITLSQRRLFQMSNQDSQQRKYKTWWSCGNAINNSHIAKWCWTHRQKIKLRRRAYLWKSWITEKGLFMSVDSRTVNPRDKDAPSTQILHPSKILCTYQRLVQHHKEENTKVERFISFKNRGWKSEI